MNLRRRCLMLGLSLSFAIPFLGGGETFAGKKPEDVFAGQVIVTSKRLPSRFSSGEAFITALKQAKTDKIWPKEQKGNDDATWKIEYVAFFSKPLDDFEVMVKFYDVTSGGRRYIAGDAQMTRERGTRVFASDIEVSKPNFEVNHKYMMVVETKGRTVASTTFWLRGKGEDYSGKVDFSEKDR